MRSIRGFRRLQILLSVASFIVPTLGQTTVPTEEATTEAATNTTATAEALLTETPGIYLGITTEATTLEATTDLYFTAGLFTDQNTTEIGTTGMLNSAVATTPVAYTEEATTSVPTTVAANTSMHFTLDMLTGQSINGTAATEVQTTENVTAPVASTVEATTPVATTVEATTETVATAYTVTLDQATADPATTEMQTTENVATPVATTQEATTVEATTEIMATTDTAFTDHTTAQSVATYVASTEEANTAKATTETMTTSGTTEIVTTIAATTEILATTETFTTDEVITTEQATTKSTTTIAWCPDDIYVIFGGYVTFPETKMAETRNSLEKCITNYETSIMHPRASRLCDESAQTGAFWRDPVFVECLQEPSINDGLDDLANRPITEDNVHDVSDALVALTNQTSLIDGKGVSSTADILDSIADTGDSSPQVTKDVINVVNNMLQVPDDSFDQDGNSSSRIVRSLEKQISLVLSEGANFSSVASSLAVQALHVPRESLSANGIGITLRESENGGQSLKEEDISICHRECGHTDMKVAASITFPGEIVDQLPVLADSVPISFTIYQKAQLFRSQILNQEASSVRRAVGSRIIAASVDGVKIQNLPPSSSILSTFSLSEVDHDDTQTAQDPTCVYWDFKLNDGVGDWSSEGCQIVSSSRERAVCSCNHLTSFAVLVDIHGQKKSSPALDIISKIGCAVSVAALIFTIGVYVRVRSLRVKIPSRILICLCLSLLCLYLVFLAGIEQTSSGTGCIVVAVLIHYFTLASLAWMAVEATNMYLFLVKVVHTLSMRHFMLKASLVAWGSPLVVVAVILAIDYTQYENEKYCFLKPGAAFMYGEMLILAIVLFYNTVIFVMVLANIYCRNRIRSSGGKNRQRKISQRVQNAIAISTLLGLTWVFGLLSVFEASNFAFQVLFSVFNSLQGLFVLLLFCVRQENIRAAIFTQMKRIRGSRKIFRLCTSYTIRYRDATKTTTDGVNSPSAIKLMVISRTSPSMFKRPTPLNKQGDQEHYDDEHPFAVKLN